MTVSARCAVEAARAMSLAPPPTRGEVSDQIVSTIVWSQTCAGRSIDGYCDALLTALFALAEDTDEDLPLVGYEDAETLMMAEYLQAGRAVLGADFDEASFREGWSWPDGLRYHTRGSFPTGLARDIGFALGYYDARLGRALAREAACR